MARTAPRVELTESEQAQLRALLRRTTAPRRAVVRASILLGAAEGQENQVLAATLKLRPATVSKVRGRFATQRLGALADAPRSGRKRKYGSETQARILAALDAPKPQGYAQWNGPLLAAHLGDIPEHQVWRVLRHRGISLQRRRSWCLSTDPEFDRKAADIVGLYLAPPVNAVVICVDEKPHMQALERAQGWLRLPNGRALTGLAHEYTRHGTSTLFAALTVATGRVQVDHYTRRRRGEFLDFMNQVVAAHPEGDLHVILDNLSTHKPKDDAWLRAHPRVKLHFTPTHASWLNQVEVWFSVLSRAALQGASFTSPAQWRQAIDDFLGAYNPKAHPFVWTKVKVHQKTPASKYSDLIK
jgi:transposase